MAECKSIFLAVVGSFLVSQIYFEFLLAIILGRVEGALILTLTKMILTES